MTRQDPPPISESQAKMAVADEREATAIEKIAAATSWRAQCYAELWARTGEKWLERNAEAIARDELDEARADAELERLHRWTARAAAKLVLD